jgi:uncharacterized membrane protein YkgB
MALLFFIILGVKVIIDSIKYHMYGNILISLAWFYISYHLLMRIFINDFRITKDDKVSSVIMRLNKVDNKVSNIILYLFLISFAIAGLYLSTIGLVGYAKDYGQKHNYVKTDGVLVERLPGSPNRDLHQDVYRYVVNNKEYYVKANSTSAQMNLGLTRPIKYNPTNPTKAYVIEADTNIASLIIGLMAVIVSTIIVIALIRKKTIANAASLVVPVIMLSMGLLMYYLLGSDIGVYNPLVLCLKNFNVMAPYILICISLILLIKNRKQLR